LASLGAERKDKGNVERGVPNMKFKPGKGERERTYLVAQKRRPFFFPSAGIRGGGGGVERGEGGMGAGTEERKKL